MSEAAKTDRRRTEHRSAAYATRAGRTVASNGYVLVKVGKEHHLADVRGYAYEHRLVAENKLGRRLLPGEQVHHIDENKQNNDPANLEVCFPAEHHLHHRSGGKAARLPGEPNPMIACACGCGAQLLRYDATNRERRYLPGHNAQPSPTTDAILFALSTGPKGRSEIVEATGKRPKVVSSLLNKLKRIGRVAKSNGRWLLCG